MRDHSRGQWLTSSCERSHCFNGRSDYRLQVLPVRHLSTGLTPFALIGVYDRQTEKLMSRPRCGNTDPIDRLEANYFDLIGNKLKRPSYVLQGSKWTNYRLTYRIKEPDLASNTYWSTSIDENRLTMVMNSSFQVWSAVTPLRFEYVDRAKQRVHISIQFSRGIHCCDAVSPNEAKFDGPKGDMAHTMYPQYGGDIHFDDDEQWKTPDQNTKGMSQVIIGLTEQCLQVYRWVRRSSMRSVRDGYY